jgi:hypothetical protein
MFDDTVLNVMHVVAVVKTGTGSIFVKLKRSNNEWDTTVLFPNTGVLRYPRLWLFIDNMCMNRKYQQKETQQDLMLK